MKRIRLFFILSQTLFMGLFLSGKPASAEDNKLGSTVHGNIGNLPLSGVAMITNSAYGRCTGVLIDPTVVLTAAHCLFAARTGHVVRPESIHVLLGYNRGNYGFHTTASAITFNKRYHVIDRSPSGQDWALLRLQERAPARFKLVRPAVVKPGMKVMAVGFGQKRREVMTRSDECSVGSLRLTGMVTSDCEVERGYSGGPLFNVATGQVVAIQIAKGQIEGKTITVSLSIVDILKKAGLGIERK